MSELPNVYDIDGVTYFRASSLGSCSKALIAARLGYDSVGPPEFMKNRFADGHLHEPQILSRVTEEFDIPWTDGQLEVDLPISSRVVVRGHIDALGDHPVYGPCVVDAKALSKASYKMWENGFFDAWPHYAWQMSAYSYGLALMGKGEVKGRPLPIVMAVKCKDNGEMRVDVFPEPPIGLSQIRVKCLQIETAARQAELGECSHREFLCPYKYLCDAPVKEIVATTTDTQLSSVAGKYHDAGQREKAAKKEREELRPLLIEVLAGRTNVALDSGLAIKVVEKKRKAVDKKAMVAAGIDPAAYEVESSYEELRVEEVK